MTFLIIRTKDDIIKFITAWSLATENPGFSILGTLKNPYPSLSSLSLERKTALDFEIYLEEKIKYHEEQLTFYESQLTNLLQELKEVGGND